MLLMGITRGGMTPGGTPGMVPGGTVTLGGDRVLTCHLYQECEHLWNTMDRLLMILVGHLAGGGLLTQLPHLLEGNPVFTGT